MRGYPWIPVLSTLPPLTILFGMALPQAPPVIPGVDAEPVANVAVTHATPTNTLVVFTSHYCPPCERFRTGAAPSLEAKGWHIEYILTDAVDTPTFMYGADSWTGYTDAGSFYARLREAF